MEKKTRMQKKWEFTRMHNIVQSNPWRLLSVQEWEKISHVVFREKTLQFPTLDRRRRKSGFLLTQIDRRVFVKKGKQEGAGCGGEGSI